MAAKKIIFVCVENACRSQMAAGFARQLARELGLELEIASGGTKPAERVDERAIQVMKEKGIDLSGERPRAISPQELRDFDYIITMGCAPEGVCPADFTGPAGPETGGSRTPRGSRWGSTEESVTSSSER